MTERSNFQLIRLTDTDVRTVTDRYATFRNLVAANEESYPGIRKWLDTKVARGVHTGERTAFLALLDDVPVATAVVKRGADAKFCHLKLDGCVRDQNLGELFFALMAAEVRQFATSVHFTLPESLWQEKQQFFRSFGFTSASRASRQYRLFEEELRCSTSFDQLWRSVVDRLPKLSGLFSIRGLSIVSPLVLSIGPEYANKIVSGTKTVELRRRFSKRWIGCRTVVYATSPEKRLVGEARIANVVAGDPDRIWSTFGRELGCSRRELDDYVGNSPEVFALVLDDVVRYAEPIPLRVLEHLIASDIDPPQSYCSTAGSRTWSAALAMAALVQGSFQTSRVHSMVARMATRPQMDLFGTGVAVG
jgi:predicted transcriptional regulator